MNKIKCDVSCCVIVGLQVGKELKCLRRKAFDMWTDMGLSFMWDY